jgi:hypothetical protein
MAAKVSKEQGEEILNNPKLAGRVHDQFPVANTVIQNQTVNVTVNNPPEKTVVIDAPTTSAEWEHIARHIHSPNPT